MAEEMLSAAERQSVIDRRLDEIDRALLGLLPRSQRLAIVADVEARVQGQGDGVSLSRETLAEAPSFAASGVRRRTRRSRLAVSSGVLGIIAIGCLVTSPILLIGLSAFGELIGEEIALAMFYLAAMLIGFGGILAVSLGGVSLLRLAGSGHSTTGTGWAITGLCTGALPMLVGLVGLLSVASSIESPNTVEVSWNAGPAAPPQYAQPGTMPTMPTMQPVPSPYGSPVPAYAPMPMTAPSNYPPPESWSTPPQLPSAPLPPGPAPRKPEAATEPRKAEPKLEAKPEAKPEAKLEALPEPVTDESTKLEPEKAETVESED
jgi:hypothetical protein